MGRQAKAYLLPIQPIMLKRLIAECRIDQEQLGQAVSYKRTTINLVLNRQGYFPGDEKAFKKQVEDYLAALPQVQQWLIERRYALANIWQPDNAKKWAKPADHGRRSLAGMKQKIMMDQETVSDQDLIIKWRVEMLNPETLKHFHLFRNPFIDDVQSERDIYFSDEHRYAKQVMVEAARYGGFVAIIGEVGSGKSVIRRAAVEELKRDGNVLIIFPQTIDKTRLTAASICDAIIYDISTERPKIKLEAKSRQVQRLLLERSKNGQRHVLIIEEAHDLNINTLKYLKRFYELEDGFRKLLGIILIGQLELKDMLNEQRAHAAREVIRRCQVAELKSLNGDMDEYLALKFKRIGADIDKIFTSEALGALAQRMTVKDRFSNKQISHIYPLLINNYAAKSMNLAAEMGEKQVTAEVVAEI